MDLGRRSLDFLAAALDEPGDLENALIGGELLSRPPAARPDDLDEARRLRDALARSFDALVTAGSLSPRDVATINSYASDEPPTLVLRGDGTAARTATDPVRAALSALARDAIDAIAGEAAHLRRCANPACGRVFLDRSRGKARRWCSMQRCGNRAKVAALRRRAPR